MKKTIKKILVSLGIIFAVVSCGIINKQQKDDVRQLGTSMKISLIIENGQQYQIDSLIYADTLPSLNKWLQNTYSDYETAESIKKQVYIKTHSDGTETVYIIEGINEPYKIIKRITQN